MVECSERGGETQEGTYHDGGIVYAVDEVDALAALEDAGETLALALGRIRGRLGDGGGERAGHEGRDGEQVEGMHV